MILDSLEISIDMSPQVAIDWSELDSDEAPDVALICIGVGSEIIQQALANGWKLKAIPQSILISMQHPTLRPMTIDASDYPSAMIPETGLPTVGTTAFMATRRDAPSELIQATLELLYRPPTIFENLIPRTRAAEWQGLDFHPTARQFFLSPVKGSD